MQVNQYLAADLLPCSSQSGEQQHPKLWITNKGSKHRIPIASLQLISSLRTSNPNLTFKCQKQCTTNPALAVARLYWHNYFKQKNPNKMTNAKFSKLKSIKPHLKTRWSAFRQKTGRSSKLYILRQLHYFRLCIHLSCLSPLTSEVNLLTSNHLSICNLLKFIIMSKRVSI